jgi:D-3-phosphoglycerate dehydrogenase
MTQRVIVSDNKVSDLDIIKTTIEDAGYDVTTIKDSSEEDIIAAADRAVGVIPDARTPISRRLIEQLNELEVIGRGGVGVDNVDMEAAADNDVTVINVPDYGVDEVSAHAMTLSLACLRKIRVFDRAIRDGTWDWTVGEPIPRLSGLTVGLVAFGKIARRHAKKWQGFGVDVIAYDPYVKTFRMHDLDVEKVSFETLLDRSDIVSVHAPLTDETEGMFGPEEFDAMKDNAVFVNTARGPIVREAALATALDEDKIEAAGLDVFEEEPSSESILLDREDVIVTPHVAWHSTEALAELSLKVAEDVVRVLEGEDPRSPIDLDKPWL